jgi:DNA-binding NarL/FixJ family response regulator
MLCSPWMAATLLRRVATLAVDRAPSPPEATLTRRELEIVALIDEGLSKKQIAWQLSIEIATVKNHVHNILEKLHVERRTEAAARVRHAAGPSPSAPPLA